MRKLTNRQIRHYSRLTNIFDVLKYYKVEYQQQPGTNRFLAHCPFHDDARPSLTIYHNDDNTYSFCCYACGEAGDVFKFIQLQEDDFKQALIKMLEILGKENLDTSLQGWYKHLQQEAKYEESLKDVVFAYQYGLGVFCRDWLIRGQSVWSKDIYDRNCKLVDDLFVEMDLFYNNCDSEKEADLYYNNKIETLINMRNEEE